VPSPARPDSRPEAARIYRKIVQLIQQDGGEAGQKLPAQTELCRQLGTNNNTLSEAMRWLIADGVLTRRPRVGTRVADVAAARSGFVVGLLTSEAALVSPFTCVLQQLLHYELASTGCCLRVSQPAGWDELIAAMEGGLTPTQLMGGEVDALVTLVGLGPAACERARGMGVSVIHAGGFENAPCGVIIDQEIMLRGAVMLLATQDCKRPLLVLGPGGERWHRGAVRGYAAGCQSAGITDTLQPLQPPEAIDGLRRGPHLSVAGGEVVGRQIAAMPEETRPDGLIAIDDHTAMGLAVALAQAGIALPLVMQTNRQTATAMALPTYRFEVDLGDLAKRTAALTLAQLQRPGGKPQVDWLEPILLEGPPALVGGG
jgi:hypothetical protein